MKECQEEAANRSQCPGNRKVEWSVRKRLQTEVSVPATGRLNEGVSGRGCRQKSVTEETTQAQSHKQDLESEKRVQRTD